MWTHMKSIHPSVAINGSTEASQKTKVKRQTSLREYQACKAKLTPTRYVFSDVGVSISQYLIRFLQKFLDPGEKNENF